MKTKILLLALSIFMISCKKDNEPIIRPIETTTAQTRSSSIEFKYPGVVAPEKEAFLSFRVSGPIEKFNVEVGSFVKKGSVIAQMDQRDYNLQLEAFKNKSIAAKNSYEAAKVVSENARKQFERVDSLYRQKVLPKKTYDEVLAGVKAARASELATYAIYQEATQGVLNSENQLKDTSLTAPYDGYIQKKLADVGTVAGAGIPVVSISSLINNKVKINVSEKDLNRFSEIEKATFNYDGKELPLKLADVGRAKSTTNLTYPVTLYFIEENNIPSDSQGTVKIYFKSEDNQGYSIPCEALFEKDSLPNVWVYQDGVVNSKEVKVIKPYYDGQVIITGINTGDKIVTKGVHELSQGQRVNLLEPTSETNIGNLL